MTRNERRLEAFGTNGSPVSSPTRRQYPPATPKSSQKLLGRLGLPVLFGGLVTLTMLHREAGWLKQTSSMFPESVLQYGVHPPAHAVRSILRTTEVNSTLLLNGHFLSPGDPIVENSNGDARMDFEGFPATCTPVAGPALFTPECGWDAPLVWSFPTPADKVLKTLVEDATGWASLDLTDAEVPESASQEACNQSALPLAVFANTLYAPYEMLTYTQKGSKRMIPWHGGRLPRDVSLRTVIRTYLQRCWAWAPTRALVFDQDPFAAITDVYLKRLAASGEDPSVRTHGAAAAASKLHTERVINDVAWSYIAAWWSHKAWLQHMVLNGTGALGILKWHDLHTDCEATLRRVLRWLSPPKHPDYPVWRVEEACAKQSFQEVFPRVEKSLWTERLTCRVWAVIGVIAQELGHSEPFGYNCRTRDDVILQLAAKAAQASNDKRTVVVTTTNLDYVDVTINWLMLVNSRAKHRLDSVIIGALDWDAHDVLQEFGAPVFPLIPRYSPESFRDREGARRFDGVWIERGEIFLLLLRTGYNVLLSDSDAVWKHDPFPLLESLEAFDGNKLDVVASAGSFPPTVSSILGGRTVVMGFVLMRANEHMIAFAQEVQELNRHLGDDQIAFNEHLAVLHDAHAGVMASAEDTEDEKSLLITTRAACTEAGMHPMCRRTHNHSLRVLILNDLYVRRNCSVKSELTRAQALHCLSSKTGGAKADILQSLGLWALPLHWKIVVRWWRLQFPQMYLPAFTRFAQVDKLELPFHERLSAAAGMGTVACSFIVIALGGLDKQDTLKSLTRFIHNLDGGSKRHDLVLELIVVLSSEQLADSLVLPQVRGNITAHSGLAVRIVTIPKGTHIPGERPIPGTTTDHWATAMNLGVRLAVANHVLCTNVDSLFVDDFFNTLKEIHTSGIAYGAHYVSTALVDVLLDGAVASGISHHFSHTQGGRLAAGVLVPTRIWFGIQGLPEDQMLAEVVEVYFLQRLKAIHAVAEWFDCGGNTTACAVTASSAKRRWSGPVEQPPDALDELVPHVSRGDALRETKALQTAGALAGIDTNCRWGLLGEFVMERSNNQVFSGSDGSARPIQVVADDVGAHGIASGCWSRRQQATAWEQRLKRATLDQRGMFVVDVKGPIEQRLQALVTAWLLAERLGRHFAVVWTPDKDCHSLYADLFDRLDSVLVLDAPTWEDMGDLPGSWIALPDGNVLDARHIKKPNIYVQASSYVQTSEQKLKPMVQDYCRRLAYMTPRKEDLFAILKFLERAFRLDRHIGLYIQQGWQPTSRSQLGTLATMSQSEAPDRCHWRNFIRPLKAAIRFRWGERVLALCDHPLACDSLRATLSPGRLMSLGAHLPSMYRAECTLSSASVLCERLQVLLWELQARAQSLVFTGYLPASDLIRFKRLGRRFTAEKKNIRNIPERLLKPTRGRYYRVCDGGKEGPPYLAVFSNESRASHILEMNMDLSQL